MEFRSLLFYNLYRYRSGEGFRPEKLEKKMNQYISKLTTGAVLGFYDQGWNFDSAVNLLKTDGKFNRTHVAVPITNPGVRDGYIEGKNPKGALPTGLNGIGITTKCKNPERLLKFYDWLLQRDVQDYILWGVEGEDWVKTESGSKAFTDAHRALWRDSARRRDETGFTVLNYLGQVFRKAMNMTIRQYLMTVRIERTKELLERTSLHVYEIADRVGFAESKYLVACFQKETGLSPAAWRREKAGK